MSGNRKPPRFPLSDGEPNPLEAVALWLLGALIAAGAVLWFAGELSGRVFGGAWPGTPPAEMGGVLVRFRDHAGDPASAWPRPQREHLPGALAFYGTLGAALIPFVGAILVAYRRRARETRESGGSARWAKRRDLRLLRVREPLPGRLTIGRVDGRLVAAEPRQSVIVVGPVQTGKTSGFAVPAILEWQGPVVTTSVKTDLLRETLIARSALRGTKVWVYDPTGTTGIPSAGWTPLAGCETWVGAQRTADWLVGGARRGNTGIDNADFWYAAAAKLLAPILFAATHSDGTMADVVRWIDTRNVDAVQAGLVRSGEPAADDAFQASIERDDRTRSSIYTTAETVLAAFADPGVLMSALTPDLRAERLLDGGCHTAYLCAPAHEQRRLQPLFATLVQEIVKVYDNGDADQKTSITSMRNLFNGNELPSQPGTGERTFVERITPAGGVAAKAGTANELNGMNELFTTGSRLAGKSFRVGEVVTINDVDPKEPRNKVTGTAKLESVVDGVAKVVSQLEISIAEQAKPMRASSTSWIEVSTSKMIKMEGKASGLIAGKGLDINEAKFTMERIH